jgi:AcrR family transcriptional regulator
MSTSLELDKHRRPGGRTAAVGRRVQEAVLGLLVEGGLAACTISNVAERANIERSTLYRKYGDRWSMMIDAILDFAEEEATQHESLGSFAEDLRFLLNRTAEILATPLGPAMWAVGAALRAGSAPQHRSRFWETRRRQITPTIIDAAIERGELPRGTDSDELIAFALGAVHFRMLVIGEQVDSATVDRIVDFICDHYCVRPRRRRRASVARGASRRVDLSK